MSSLDFYLSRFNGEIGQSYIAGLFRFWGFEVKEVPQGYFPYYDLFCSKVENGKYRAFTVEVKTDRRMPETGNACLELDGLNHSKADFLAICSGEPIRAVYLMPLDPAREFAKKWEPKREVGHLKSGKPNYAAIVSEDLLLRAIPKICKLIVPHNELQ